MADVAVIGAGLNGLATAWALDRAGVDVVVYEQFEPGHTRGSSHGRTRIFRLAYPEETWVRFAQEALEGWRELERESGEELLVLSGLLELYREGVAELTGGARGMRRQPTSCSRGTRRRNGSASCRTGRRRCSSSRTRASSMPTAR